MGNTLLNTHYTLIAINKPYFVPPNPGLMPVITIWSTEVHLVNLVWAHRKSLRERKEWLNIGQSVKKKMQEALPPRDIKIMRYLHSVFQNMQAQDLLAHMIAQCPTDPFMISENKAQLKEAWDARASFVYLVERAFKVQVLDLDTERTVDSGEIMTEVYAIIYHTGILTEDCEKWDEPLNTDKI